MKINKKIIFAPWAAENKNYYSYQTWYKPLKKIFNRMIVFDPQKELLSNGKEEMNRKFIELIKKEKPDYIFLWLIGEEFFLETLLKIKEISPKTKLINYCCDEDTLFENYTYYYSLFIDYFLVTDKEHIQDYENKPFLFLATDTETFKPMNLNKIYDVTFVGTPKVDRAEYVRYLLQNGISVRLFGFGWEDYPEFKDIYGGAIESEEYNKIINQSKINLCFTKNYHRAKHINQRPFEIAASKSFFLMEASPGYSDFFKEGEDVVTFKDKEELLQKVEYYLNNKKEKNKIADKVYKKIRKSFSGYANLSRFFKSIESDKKLNNHREIFFSEPSRVYSLPAELLRSSHKTLKDILRGYDYVVFENKSSISLNHRLSLQYFSLKHTGKPISCCNYYLYSRLLGNYLLLNANTAHNLLSEEDFSKFVDLGQLMVEKDFFLNNLKNFNNFLNRQAIGILTDKNTAFVSIPLVRLKKDRIPFFKNMTDYAAMLFVTQLKVLKNKHRLFRNLYPLKLLMYSLFKEPLILKYLIEKAKLKNIF